MNAVVVYESFWGNTAAVARAIAEGIGGDTRALSTAEAAPEVIRDADLIVAGAPVMAFSLPTDSTRQNLANQKAPTAPDLSNPSMRSWLASLPAEQGLYAAFETRFRWSPGGAVKALGRGFERAGYRPAAEPAHFSVTGMYGPVRDGEIERARQWGAALAKTVS
jgi:flavorubredoxin